MGRHTWSSLLPTCSLVQWPCLAEGPAQRFLFFIFYFFVQWPCLAEGPAQRFLFFILLFFCAVAVSSKKDTILEKRNELSEETDYFLLPDVVIDQDKLNAIKIYRK